MICRKDPLQEAPFTGQEETQEEEEDFPMVEEDHQEENHQEEDYPREEETTMEDEDQTSWWETLQKYSKEYERKLSLSLLFGGSTQVLTMRIPPLPTRIRRASYSSHTFTGTTWLNGSNQ